MDNASLFKALVNFQRSVTNVAKDKQANTGKFGYTYADIAGVIEAVKEPLAANGLCYMQVLTNVDGRPAIRTILAHEEGGSIEGTVTLQGDLNDPQKFGGICTYYRRYGLLGVLGLATEDDDANHARTPPPATDFASARGVRPGSIRPEHRESVDRTQSPRPGPSQGADEDMTWGDLYSLTRPEGYPNRAALEQLIGRHFDDLTPAQVFALFKEAHGLPPAPRPEPQRRRGTITDKQLNAIRVMLPKKGMDDKAWPAWAAYTLGWPDDLDLATCPKPHEITKEEASTVIEELGNMPDNPGMQAILEASGR